MITSGINVQVVDEEIMHCLWEDWLWEDWLWEDWLWEDWLAITEQKVYNT